MPRTARLLIKDGCYHIISRGIEKRQTYFSDSDYLKYLKLIKKYKDRLNFKLYGWCLMPNHPHLIISSDNLSKTMHIINFSYAQYFNYKYNRVGYVWQNRFKSHVVQKDKYLCLYYKLQENPALAYPGKRHYKNAP